MAPSSHVDHIGSFLRPDALLEARTSLGYVRTYGVKLSEEIEEIKNNAIREIVAEQLKRRITPITNGEYARHIFYEGFFEKLGGMTFEPALPVPESYRTDFPTAVGYKAMGLNSRDSIVCTGPITYPSDPKDSPYLSEWLILRSALPSPSTWPQAKLTIPAISTLHIQFAVGWSYTPESGYTSDEDYLRGLAACYKQEFRTLYDAGLRNIQIDDPHMTYFCDSRFLSGCTKDNVDPDALLDTYLRAHDWCLEDKPADLHVGVHLCRGNWGSNYFAVGGYERIANKLFNHTAYTTYYLEFDDEDRDGGFEPLRFLPRGQGKRVVLGLVSTKTSVLEDKAVLVGKIERAVDVLVKAWGCERKEALDALAISPQCGFSSASANCGDGMDWDGMWKKLELVKEVAGQVWED